MKKLAKLYDNNKLIFIIITLLWIEIVTEICGSLLSYMWKHSWNGFGNPVGARTTHAGSVVEWAAIGAFGALVVIPVIVLMVAFVKYLDFKINAALFLIVAVVAVVIGLVFSSIHDIGISKAVYSLAEYLDDKYVLLEEGYI